MKFVHLADLHFSNDLPYNRINPKTGLGVRFEDQLEIFNSIRIYMVKKKISLLVIVGDIYDDYNPSNVVRAEVCKLFKRFIDDGIGIIIVIGNHDTDGAYHALQDIKNLKVDNITIVDKPRFLYWNGGLVKRESAYESMYCIPWMPIKEQFQYLNNNKKKVDVLVMHCDVIGGVRNYTGNKSKVGLDVGFLSKQARYVALGHYHIGQKWGNVVYSGVMMKTTFSELGYLPGFNVIDIDKGNVSLKKVFLRDRCFIRVRSNKIKEVIKLDGLKGAIVEIMMKSKSKVGSVLKEKLLRKGAYYVKERYIDKDIGNIESFKMGSKDVVSLKTQLKDYVKGKGYSEQIYKLALKELKEEGGIKA